MNIRPGIRLRCQTAFRINQRKMAMTQTVAPFCISRVFNALCNLVFEVHADADHLQKWDECGRVKDNPCRHGLQGWWNLSLWSGKSRWNANVGQAGIS